MLCAGEGMSASTTSLQEQARGASTGSVTTVRSLDGFRLLMETSPDAILVAHMASDVVADVNDAAVALFDLSRHSLIGRRVAELPLGWSGEQAREHFIRTVLHEGTVRDAEHAFMRRSGEVRLGRLSAYRQKLDGQLYIIFVCRDTTESRTIRASLEKSEQRFRRLFTEMVSGCVLLEYAKAAATESRQPGKDKVCLYCAEANPAFARLTGLEVADITGRALSDVLGTGEQSLIAPLEDVAVTGKPAHFVQYSRRLRKWFELSAYRPAPGQVACTFVDVTENRRGQRQLAKAQMQLELAQQTRSRFIATLSHELRTPLMPILTAVSALEADPCLPIDIKEDLALIRRNAEMEARLINGLLDLTEFAAGTACLHRQPLDLLAVMREAAGSLAALLDARGLSLRWEVTAEMRTVDGDQPRLRQVFHNLIRNALEHTPPNGLICLRLEPRPGARIAAEVQDSGEGIPRHMLCRVFDAFDQGTHRPGSRHGKLGLGLTLCRSIVELHGGRIEADSDGPGRGACFTITLPLYNH